MGSCAQLWAIEAAAWERLGALPPPPPERDLAEEAEVVCSWQFDPTCALATWRDGADNDLSRIATGERRGLPPGLDARALAPLLGLAGTRPALPWWVNPLWPRDGHAVGWLTPAQVREVRDAAGQAGLFAALAPSLSGLEAFLERAAALGCGLMGAEGQS